MSSLIGQTLLHRYEIRDLIGRGGVGEVYLAWDPQRMTRLAVKVLHEDLAYDKVFMRRFQREAETLAKLQHPNIVRFYRLEVEGHRAFMLLDYIEGDTLHARLFKLGRPMTTPEVMEVVEPVIAVLHYAHSHGIVHCDVKPANVMLEKTGRVLVGDFGIARMMDAATATLVGAGTPAYMAPEQIKGEVPTPQTDIYALGVMLFEMLTGGERPFTGERATITGSTATKVRWEHLNLDPPPMHTWNPELPSEVEAVVLRCLAKDPTERYDSIQDLLVELRVGFDEIKPEDATTLVFDDEPPPPSDEQFEQVEPVSSPPGFLRSRAVKWVAAAAVVMAVLLGGAMLLGGQGDQDPNGPSTTEASDGDALVNPDQSASSTASGDGGQTASQTTGSDGSYNTEGVNMTNLQFGADVSASDQPLGLGIAFPSRSTQICLFWEYEGMENGMGWGISWYSDGEYQDASSFPNQIWNGGGTGTWWACISSDTGLEDGLYEVVLEVVGDPIASESVYVGGDREIVSLTVANNSGEAICYLQLSPSEAQNWGPDELGPQETIQPGQAQGFEIASGVYDVRILNCNFEELAEQYGIEVGDNTTYTLSQ
jgi:serine/threonine protein kinase